MGLTSHNKRGRRTRDTADIAIPSAELEAETERLLAGRTRNIKLTGGLLELYRKRSWPQRRTIARAWAVWVGIIGLLFIPLVYFSVPSAFGAAVIAGAVLSPLANGCFFLLWQKQRGSLIEGLSVVALMTTTMIAFGSVGAAGGPEVVERYITGMLFVGVIAIMVFSIDLIWTLALAGAISATFSVFTILNPYIGIKVAICHCIFYAMCTFAVTMARRASQVLAHKSFLMSLRDNYRSEALTLANRQLEALATRDPVTGIANRRAAADHIQKIWSNRTVAKTGVAFVMADIDHFKKLNDTAGHAAGDDCLRLVAETIEASVRTDKDIACRYGGEEFLIVLTDVTAETAWTLAERIRSGIEALGIVNPGLEATGDAAGVVTASLGIAFATDDDARPDLVIKRADDALYDAKHGGRNRVFMAAEPDRGPAPAEIGVLSAA